MRRWIFSTLVPVLFLTACSGNRAGLKRLCEGFLPENTLNIPESKLKAVATGISRANFDQVLDRIQNLYSAEFAGYGASLKIERNWSDGTVNAYAYRDENDESIWIISMFGGFARHKAITYDGFASVACHEIGHHVGGAPVYKGDWASVEGQSDYYATVKCLKRLFEKDDNLKVISTMKLDSIVVNTCNTEHASKQDRALCIRVAMAGVSLAGVLQSLEGGVLPKVGTPTKSIVRKTIETHPRAQCRLDTYFQGSLCRQSPYSDVSSRDPAVGYCYDVTTFAKGRRPRCWFAP